jgi:hypothetical protein
MTSRFRQDGADEQTNKVEHTSATSGVPTSGQGYPGWNETNDGLTLPGSLDASYHSGYEHSGHEPKFKHSKDSVEGRLERIEAKLAKHGIHVNYDEE